MPLLHKKPFIKKEPSRDFRNDEELFHCEMTNELFRDYEEFCERIILCNSLVWSCSLTGKPNLTYQEALESEENARATLNEFPMELRIPVLYLASKTQRSSFGDLTEDVFSYARDRYFIGENVEVSIRDDTWSDGYVLQVMGPSVSSATNKSPDRHSDRYFEPPSSLYTYEVEELDDADKDVTEIHIVNSSQVRRRKGVYTREKNRVYLRQFAERIGTGSWGLKSDVLQTYGISRVKFENIFVGDSPNFKLSKKIKYQSPSKKRNNLLKKEGRQETIGNYFSPASKQIMQPMLQGKHHNSNKAIQNHMAKNLKAKYKNVAKKGGVTKKLLVDHQLKRGRGFKEGKYRLSDEMRTKLKEQAMEEKQRRLEERVKEREKRKEEKLRLAEFVKQWNRQREDLECEDLKELPPPAEIHCGIPNQYFGDLVLVLEFLHLFSDTLSSKSFFPNGVSFEVVERALCVPEVAGPLAEIIQLLLLALFNMQEEEDDEVLETDSNTAAVDLDIDELGDVTTAEAIRLATTATNWSQTYQGLTLGQLTLDPLTLTEILRLHLLSSGGRSGEMSSKWRYQQRGGYTTLDDPGLILRIQEPQLLRTLSTCSVCDLPIGDKVKILTCLINQILTYSVVRDVIDERGEKMKQARTEIRAIQLAELKRERELALRIKEKKIALLKSKENGAMENVVIGSAAGNGAARNDAESDGEEQSEESKESLKLKLEKESMRRRLELQKKWRELHQAAVGHQILPLGTDRAHRRFWLFTSLPGLFVEHDEAWAGPCLENPTPHNPASIHDGDTLAYVHKLFEGERCSSGSDKENDATPTRPHASPNKKVAVGSDRTVRQDVKQDLLVCTADSGCPVHCCAGTGPKWSFFSRAQDVTDLIESLNKRGIREGELRQVLVQEQERILESVGRCPYYKLDTTQEAPAEVPEQRKSSRTNQAKNENSNFSFPIGTPMDSIFEQTLIEYLIEMEDKIHMGGLGSLKAFNRNEWRANLVSRNYQEMSQAKDQGTSVSSNNIPVEKVKLEERSSQPSTPDSELNYKDPARLLGANLPIDLLAQSPVIKNLANALLEVAQSVEIKYLQKPLGSEDSLGEKTLAVMRRWEMSLKASTSFSQIFLHLSTLDNSIQWSKSALNAHCRLCRRRGDGINMLLCDSCNKGHHLYCLKPKLMKVPTGDWFCPKCRPTEKVRPSKRSRRLFSQEEEEAEETEYDEEEEEGDVEEEEEDEEYEEQQDSGRESEHGTTCSVCGNEGRLLECDTCSLAFHRKCIVPTLKLKPKGRWTCYQCKPTKALPRRIRDAVQEPSQNRQQRCCAALAVANISKFAKRLRSHSWDDESSAHSEDVQPSRRSSRRSNEVDLDMPFNTAVLQDLLSEVMRHRDSWPFLRPVLKAEVPDYHLIIKRPMDFGTMKYKLNMLEYMNTSEFIADALLVFENCQMYNQLDAQEYKAGVRLGRYFEKRCKELGLQLKEEELRPMDSKKPRHF